MRRYVS